MDQFSKEGRKLRPRKTAASQPSYEKVEFHRNDENREGDRHPRNNYGENRSYGERRNFGEHRSYGENRGSNEHRNYGEHRETRSYGERRSNNFGENRSFGERRNSGEHRSYGEHREGGNNYSERRPRNNYGENRSYGERRNSGETRSYGENRGSSETRNYGERKPRTFSSEHRPSGPRSAGSRPAGKPGFNKKSSNGFKKNFAPKDTTRIFSKEAGEGIENMITRRPVVNGKESENKFDFPIKDEIRLNKFIANSGVCSRREADTLIQAGVVSVNGVVVTELGTKVNIHNDDIRFNGERLKGEEKVYLIMNKPRGFVTTSGDPHAEKTVLDLIKGCTSRVYPVGRLDKNTTGVLMLTNDGEIAERLTHPSYDKKKIYQVALDRELSQEDYEKILSGVELTDGTEKADELEYIDSKDKRKLGIEIHSGKNRIVRRLFEGLGYNVKALDRVYFAGLTKKGLKKGEWRYLSEGEVNILRMGAYI